MIQRILIIIAMVTPAVPVWAAGSLVACEVMLRELKPARIEAGVRQAAIGEFIRENLDERRSITEEIASIEKLRLEFQLKIDDDRQYLAGIDWALDRLFGLPSAEAQPWAKQTKKLGKQIEKLRKELNKNEGGFDLELFSRLGSGSHYFKRLKDYYDDYTWRLEDVNWALETLSAVSADLAVIESKLPEDADALTRLRHEAKVLVKRRRVAGVLDKQMRSLLQIRDLTQVLTAWVDLRGLPTFIETRAQAEQWIATFESARPLLLRHHDRVRAKYEAIRNLAIEVATSPVEP